MPDLRLASCSSMEHSSSHPLPIAKSSLGGRRKWSDDHEDPSWDLYDHDVPSPYGFLASNGHQARSETRHGEAPTGDERHSDVIADSESLAELAFLLGDCDTNRAECSCEACQRAVNESSDDEPRQADCWHECPVEHHCLHIPESFYARLAPLIPVIPLPRMDSVNLEDDDGWYSVGLREKAFIPPPTRPKCNYS